MTRKAHNVDRQRTAGARFQDKRSYWTNDGHEFLFGEDMRDRRWAVYDRDRGFCQECKRNGMLCWVGWNEAHMHHIQGGLVGRCSCMHNLEILCADCHRYKHPQVKFGKTNPEQMAQTECRVVRSRNDS